jgi:hemerythrin
MMIDFNQIPRVAIDFMNDDHENVTELTNKLMTLISSSQVSAGNIKQINDALSELLCHCREHFAREEEQMKKYNYPLHSVHKADHNHILMKFEEELSAWQSEEDISILEKFISTTFTEWFIIHIETLDTVTAIFLTQSAEAE